MAYTGYLIVTYLDVNPKSPTFNTTKEERVYDTQHCSGDTANWEVVSRYCELSGGSNTGYYIVTEMDTNLDSPTYGETRDTKTYNTTNCPVPTSTADWVIIDNSMYCEIKKFPSGVSGETGNLKFMMKDENPSSPTYNQIVESSMTESDWTVDLEERFGEFPCEGVDTEPEVEPISEACVMTICDGVSTTNGKKRVFGIDKNLYSDTYLQSVETIVTDTTTCPDNCTAPSYVFTWSDGTTARTNNLAYSAQTINVAVVSTKDGNAHTFTVESGSATIVGQSIMVSVTENSSTTESKTSYVTLKQNNSNKTIMLTIVQAAAPSYIFTWSDGTTAKTSNVSHSAQTLSFGVVSSRGGTAQEWSVYSGTATKTLTGITVSLTENTSSSSTKTTSITLKQTNSNKTISIDIVQAAAPSYVFQFSDGTTAKTDTVSHSASTILHTVTSTKNGIGIGYEIEESCAWLTATSGANVTITTTQNTSLSARTCNVTLRQAESDKTITVSVTQQGKPTIRAYAASDKYLIDGTSATTFTVHYWGTSNDTIITSDVTLEAVALDAGESALTYTEVSSGNDGKLYKVFSVQPNDINKIRYAKFRAKYGDTYSNVITIKQSGVDQTVLPDFDFLTFTFTWTENDGKDFDTATFVKGSNLPIISGKTLDEMPVGYGCNGSSSIYSAATKVYLQHGGDNMKSGNECALVNWKTICDHDFISEGITTLYCELWGNWYNEYVDGNCSATFKTYKGEGMKHGTDENPFIFVPSGNTQLVTEMTVSGHVRAFSSSNASQRRNSPTGDESGYYSHVASLEYDIASKTAFFTNMMTTPTGRNLRGYGIVDGVLQTGGNGENLPIRYVTYDASAQSGSLIFSNFQNVINGVTYNATGYEVDIKYYAKDGHPLQEGYATASINGNTLSWHLDANPTGERREADIILRGLQTDRPIAYRVECTQS